MDSKQKQSVIIGNAGCATSTEGLQIIYGNDTTDKSLIIARKENKGKPALKVNHTGEHHYAKT